MSKIWLVKYDSQTAWGTPYHEETAFTDEQKATTFVEDRTKGAYEKVGGHKYLHRESGSTYTIEALPLL